MDILIKNMEQIDGCYYCPFLMGKSNNFCVITGSKVRIEDVREKYEDERMADCPLVALPSHGDLIDRSFLKGASYEIIRFSDEEANKMFLELIDNAPTIVEATE